MKTTKVLEIEDYLQNQNVFVSGINGKPSSMDSYMTIIDPPAFYKAMENPPFTKEEFLAAAENMTGIIGKLTAMFIKNLFGNMDPTKEDINKYGTKEEIKFLLEFHGKRARGVYRLWNTDPRLQPGGDLEKTKSCDRCKKEITKKEYLKNGRLCDMCEEDVALGRDKE